MRFGSVCSGIEAASVAWEPLGWEAAWFSEIEPFPSAVLKHHYPDTKNLGDMTSLPKRILSTETEAPEIFCGGTPCQAFSVAGLRKSLDDERGNLSLTFCEIANAIDHVRSIRGEQPCIVFWENVPGVLNTKDNAFGCFLGALSGADTAIVPSGRWTDAGVVDGPQRTVAWRTLDAQFFGLAQRRRRVFVVASARDGFDPAAVLFEWEGLRRDSAPSRKAGEAATGTIEASLGRSRGAGTPTAAITPIADPAYCLETTCNDYSRADGFNMLAQPVAFPANLSGTQCASSENIAPAMGAKNPTAVAFDSYNLCETGDITQTLKSPQGGVTESIGAVRTAMQVRRLTPVECERLQGFPDGYTAIPWRNKPASECPDGPRYKALGNSWAVPVVRWIGKKIAQQVALSAP